MAIELEGLQFKVEGLTENSYKGLENLAHALYSLKMALPTKAKISGVTSSLAELTKSINNLPLSDVGVKKFMLLSNALFRIGQAKVSASIGKNLQSIGDAAATITTDDVRRMRELSEALSGLKDIGTIRIRMPSTTTTPAEKTESALNQWTDLDPQVRQARGAVGQFFDTIRTGAGVVGGALGEIKAKFQEIGMVAGYVGGKVSSVLSPLARIPAFFGKDLEKGAQSATGKLTGLFASLKRIAMYRLLRTAIKMFTQGLSEGLKNVYAYSQLVGTSFASTMDRIATNSLYLKNSLGAMVAPLVSALAPAVEYVTDKFVELFNVVNMFIARLAGSSTATIARRTATTWGDATADSAGKAKDAVDELKRTILGFDELNVLNGDNDSGSGGGSGGGSGTDAGSMFEQVPITGAISEFADKLKAEFAAGNWDEVGTIIGAKFNEIVNDVPWAEIGTTIGTGINAAIHIVYSALSEADFVNLGSKFATLVNSALTEIDFDTLGALMVRKFTVLADLLIGAITTVDWGLVASKASDFVIGVFSEIGTWIQSVNWAELTTSLFNSIVDFVTNVNWPGIVSSISEAFGSALGAISSVGATLISTVFDGVKTWLIGVGTWISTNIITPFVNEFKSDDPDLLGVGLNIMAGIGQGIINWLLSIGTWVKTNVLDPLVKGFCDTFGIASPATNESVVSIGKNIMAGIANGIIDWFIGIGTWVKTNVLDPFINGIKTALGLGEGGAGKNASLIDIGKNLIKGVFQGVIDWIGGIGSWIQTNVIDKFTDAWDTLVGENGLASSAVSIGVGLAKSGWTTVQGWFEGLGSGIISGVASVFAWLKQSSAWTTVQGWFEGLGSKVVDAATNIYAELKQSSAWNTVQGWFDKLGGAVTGAVTTVYAWVKQSSAWSTVQGWFDGLGSKVIGAVTTVYAELKKSSAWSTVQSWFNGLGGAVTGAVSYIYAWLKKSSAWTTVQGWFNSLGAAVTGGVATILVGLKNVWTSISTWFFGLEEKYRTVVGYDGISVKLAQAWTSISNWFFSLNNKFRTVVGYSGVSVKLGQAWTTISNWFFSLNNKFRNVVGYNGISVRLGQAWDTISNWFWGLRAKFRRTVNFSGIAVKLSRVWSSINDWFFSLSSKFRRVVNFAGVLIKLVPGWSSIQSWFNGLSSRYNGGGDIELRVNANVRKDAKGGVYSGGSWHNIPQYASGGIPSHGTLFVAGEAGAEAVAHINGRTEVLNQSQLASAIYSAVLSAMQQSNAGSPMLNVTVRTENNEVLARAVARGQKSLDARMTPSGAY